MAPLRTPDILGEIQSWNNGLFLNSSLLGYRPPLPHSGSAPQTTLSSPASSFRKDKVCTAAS